MGDNYYKLRVQYNDKRYNIKDVVVVDNDFETIDLAKDHAQKLYTHYSQYHTIEDIKVKIRYNDIVWSKLPDGKWLRDSSAIGKLCGRGLRKTIRFNRQSKYNKGKINGH